MDARAPVPGTNTRPLASASARGVDVVPIRKDIKGEGGWCWFSAWFSFGVSDTMDWIYVKEISMIHWLQTSVLTNKPMVDVLVHTPQYLADPDTLMIYMFPLILVFNQWLACRMALTIGVVDMLNTVLKWLLFDDRPYWWVYEVSKSGSIANLPTLEHHPLTCETGPGSPSGHCMSSAAVGFVLVSAVLDQYKRHVKNTSHRSLQRALWLFYILIVSTISVARLRLATHFPHQVVLGVVAGFLGGWFVWNLPIDRLRLKHYIWFTLSMFICALMAYIGLQLFGVDANRTVQLALKCCVDRSYVKMSTTPWHSVYRNSALMLSAGYCATNSTWKTIITQTKFSTAQKCVIVLLSLGLAQTLASIPYPYQPTFVFYPCTVVKNVSIVLGCLLLVPMAVIPLSGTVTPSKTVPIVKKVSGQAIRHG